LKVGNNLTKKKQNGNISFHDEIICCAVGRLPGPAPTTISLSLVLTSTKTAS